MRIKSFKQFQPSLNESMASALSNSPILNTIKFTTILEKYTKYKTLVKFKQGFAEAIEKGYIKKEDIQELINIVNKKNPEIPMTDKLFCMFIVGCGCDFSKLIPDMTEEQIDEYYGWSQDIYEDSLGTGIIIPTFEKFMTQCKQLCTEVGIPVSSN